MLLLFCVVVADVTVAVVVVAVVIVVVVVGVVVVVAVIVLVLVVVVVIDVVVVVVLLLVIADRSCWRSHSRSCPAWKVFVETVAPDAGASDTVVRLAGAVDGLGAATPEAEGFLSISPASPNADSVVLPPESAALLDGALGCLGAAGVNADGAPVPLWCQARAASSLGYRFADFVWCLVFARAPNSCGQQLFLFCGGRIFS